MTEPHRRSVASPLSFAGSTSRILNGTRGFIGPPRMLCRAGGWWAFARGAWLTAAWFWVGLMLLCAWWFILAWYGVIIVFWPLLVVTGVWRVLRRGQRQRQQLAEDQLAVLRSIQQQQQQALQQPVWPQQQYPQQPYPQYPQQALQQQYPQYPQRWGG